MKEIVRQSKLTEDDGEKDELPVGKNEIEAAEERYQRFIYRKEEEYV